MQNIRFLEEDEAAAVGMRRRSVDHVQRLDPDVELHPGLVGEDGRGDSSIFTARGPGRSEHLLEHLDPLGVPGFLRIFDAARQCAFHFLGLTDHPPADILVGHDLGNRLKDAAREVI